MSITYALYLGSDRRPKEVIDQLSAALGVRSVVRENVDSVQTFEIPGLDVSAGEVRPPVDKFILEDFGVAPKVRMTLRLHKDDLSKSQDKVVEVLNVLMGQTSGDLLLLREDESIAYKRSGGQTELGDTDPLWADAGRKSRLDKAQRRRRITLS